LAKLTRPSEDILKKIAVNRSEVSNVESAGDRHFSELAQPVNAEDALDAGEFGVVSQAKDVSRARTPWL
jgi:hypothetical protein